MRAQFKKRSTQFDSFVRKYTAQVQQYSTPRGDLDQAAEANSTLTQIGEQSIEEGQIMLNELNDLADCGAALFSSEQGEILPPMHLSKIDLVRNSFEEKIPMK